MNTTQRKPLELIFAEPLNGNIEWRKVEALLLALGAVRSERSCSDVSFVLNDVRVDFHRPHPNKEALRYRIKDARRFLEQAGITP
jgi:HicA toxin of bacterial toxin-antitoxin,